MTTWWPRPTTTCCAVVLGNEVDYVGYDPQLDLAKGDHFCGKPVDHKVDSKSFNTAITLSLCTEHFTYLVTYHLKWPVREHPS
jgi:hypothetical protein